MNALDRERDPDPAMISEARTLLLTQTRRQTLMEGQLEVLQGKDRALRRYHERLGQIVPKIGGAPDVATDGVRQLSAGAGAGTSSRDVMAAQEEMRREIARQMHDGPAQSTSTSRFRHRSSSVSLRATRRRRNGRRELVPWSRVRSRRRRHSSSTSAPWFSMISALSPPCGAPPRSEAVDRV